MAFNAVGGVDQYQVMRKDAFSFNCDAMGGDTGEWTKFTMDKETIKANVVLSGSSRERRIVSGNRINEAGKFSLERPFSFSQLIHFNYWQAIKDGASPSAIGLGTLFVLDIVTGKQITKIDMRGLHFVGFGIIDGGDAKGASDLTMEKADFQFENMIVTKLV